MTSPENTAAGDRATHGLGMMAFGASDYITGQERAGQAQLVHSDVLPAAAPWADAPPRFRRGDAGSMTLDDLGFVRGEPVPGDDLFVRCTIPAGWSRTGTDHAMWSAVADERGIERVAVFYKAAFYDRKAHAAIVNVGRAAASRVVYGDEPVAQPEHWPVLTEDERADTVAECERYIAEAKEYPGLQSMQEHEARAQALLELIRS